jgi:hypothetical protein
VDKEALTRLEDIMIHPQTLAKVILHPLDMMFSFVSFCLQSKTSYQTMVGISNAERPGSRT